MEILLKLTNVYSVTNGLTRETITTPFDYSAAFGIRKIARFGYENKANTFYNGTESSYGDAATIGLSPFVNGDHPDCLYAILLKFT